MLRNVILNSLLASTAFGAALRPRRSSWTPQMGEKWQIILSGTPDVSAGLSPGDATVWDLDLFNTPADTIASIKSSGKSVVCYFSAGTSEPDRPDLGSLNQSNVGAGLPDWPGENWLDIRSDNVFQIMSNRIQLAAQNGCDAVDPDNMDGYSNQNGGGFANPLTQQDSINFLQKMAGVAQQYGLLIGLKNAEEIISSVTDIVQFAVNEQCAATGDCSSYDSFLSTGKPVFHIEYPNDKSGAHKSASDFCLSGTQEGSSFSTVLKNLSLDGYVEYCDGSSVTTPTVAGGK